jgi:hypothetical protein
MRDRLASRRSTWDLGAERLDALLSCGQAGKAGEMGPTDNYDDYQKGYEDAMRAASGSEAVVSSSASTSPSPTTSTSTVPASYSRVQQRIGTTLGLLVAFPLVAALIGGIFGLAVGNFTGGALLFGGLAFVFALFVGAIWMGIRLIRWWLPLAIVAMIVYIIVTKSTG